MKTIFDDKLLSLRLQGHPEFLLRLAEFLQSYGVADRPSLVLQARQTTDAEGGATIDVNDREVQKRFLAGVPTDNGWWQGFRSMVAPRPTFHGIASLPTRDQPAWAAEAHRDGHFISGIWRFPEVPAGHASVPAIADFYADMFEDFFQLVASTLQAISDPPRYEVTASVLRAHELHYVTESRLGGRRVVAPLTNDSLQWPVAAARVGAPEWMPLARQMSQALAGAYGDNPPRRQ
jgi:hypothetical protein